MSENEDKQRILRHIIARKAAESPRFSRREREPEKSDPEMVAWLTYKKIEARLRNVNRMLSDS